MLGVSLCVVGISTVGGGWTCYGEWTSLRNLQVFQTSLGIFRFFPRAPSVPGRASRAERPALSVPRRASRVKRPVSSVQHEASRIERRGSSVPRRAFRVDHPSVSLQAYGVERPASCVPH